MCLFAVFLKRPFGRCSHRWKNDMRMDLKEIGYEGMGWIILAHDRDWWWALVNTAANLLIL
jgi:hypothetical protein